MIHSTTWRADGGAMRRGQGGTSLIGHIAGALTHIGQGIASAWRDDVLDSPRALRAKADSLEDSQPAFAAELRGYARQLEAYDYAIKSWI